jgi:hypothetical protein
MAEGLTRGASNVNRGGFAIISFENSGELLSGLPRRQ